MAVTVPIRALGGQLRARTCAAGQARPSWVRSAATIGGSRTVTADCPACSGPCVMTVRTGGFARRAVSPLRPIAASMCGSKPSAPQLVGVKLLVRDDGRGGRVVRRRLDGGPSRACRRSGCA